MRPSKRDAILGAALGVVERGGVSAVTFESVATAAGVTKAGVVYHFPTREALLLALQEYLAHQWQLDLEAQLGTPVESASQGDKLAAYARDSSHSSSRAELLLMLETVDDPQAYAPWHAVMSRWTPALDTDQPMGDAELDHAVARLAADGLWLYESLSTHALSPGVRQQIVSRLSALAHRPDGPAAPGGPGRH
ncbi:TetR/AcrR family transcriptional regulator [Propionibacterium freudenreichii]|uniref:Regulatory protein, TetR n=1 Tax=Propionibacterium freudenreichii subsp. freudenreichii TaxID=66712 RepID=A0A0B7NQ64_PROFF|nr:TetR family transcriptional regulator [Propionibacterium freudenreichii]MDN5962092.1 TetR/AcrR family transcriptional regulator [Propionibacterium sp.]AJQ90785.1 Regulatory protein, TetR [Propionibacterium freudenreichii subsp. freudenreichii]MCT2973998.1 TetR/AcrR family transcriptional regulator [Propionibacterium freudenreichii]MCT2975788.1 TetR/AcrR family transcriptional regulator [Propionibacterium freudenreichii]MCT2977775.1 TetR/AcrR family transcriptional regulator [Propionibacteri